MQGVSRRESFAAKPLDRFLDQTIAAVLMVPGGFRSGLNRRFNHEWRAIAGFRHVAFQDFQQAGINVNVGFGFCGFGAAVLCCFNADSVPVP